MSNSSSEPIDNTGRVLEQIHQRWNGRLDFPLTKIPERYTGLQYAIALSISCQFRGVNFGMCPLITIDDGRNGALEHSRASVDTEKQFPVFIDNIEVVDDKEGIVRRVGGFIGLKSFDQPQNLRARDPMYFSLVSFKFLWLDRLFEKHRKINGKVVLLGACGEMPRNMVKAGSELMNSLPCEHAESYWRDAIPMVLNRLKESLVVVLWDSGIFAFIKEPLDLDVEIQDVLFGPV